MIIENSGLSLYNVLINKASPACPIQVFTKIDKTLQNKQIMQFTT